MTDFAIALMTETTAASFVNYAARPHVLVVDDDVRILSLVSRYLREHGFVVMTAEDASAAKEMLRYYEYDALVLDVMMPGQSGLELTRDIRQERNLPVLLLTALGETEDRISGLEAGADDYLAKPFEPKELVLRLNAILRRTRRSDGQGQAFRVGRWRYDPEANVLRDGGESVRLTDVEGALLRALAGKAGQAVGREELAGILKVDPEGRSIDVQVTRLRRKIEEDAKAPQYLQTVRGQGYLLRAEVL